MLSVSFKSTVIHCSVNVRGACLNEITWRFDSSGSALPLLLSKGCSRYMSRALAPLTLLVKETLIKKKLVERLYVKPRL